MTKFETGRTYSTRSVCDHECIFEFTVTKRSPKFITTEDRHGRVRRSGVSIGYDGLGEISFPMGKYSMAPIINA